jgi:hypothetical protein
MDISLPSTKTGGGGGWNDPAPQKINFKSTILGTKQFFRMFKN